VRTLITGGAGFIGANLAARLCTLGHEVVIADNLSRHGSDRNLELLLSDPARRKSLEFVRVDVRDGAALADLVAGQRPDAVAHLAAQVSVAGSLSDPSTDFDVNARGTLNLLEALRIHAPGAQLVYTSSNKVYGSLNGLSVHKTTTRYHLPDHPNGISELQPTAAATPYGCSKLAGDIYVTDYAHTFGLNTTVFRMSCIYGPWQNGTVDQGWVSWLVQSAVAGREITIYGDGLQARDLLHIDDLTDALIGALEGRCGSGEVYNVGGGPGFSLSVWAEFGPLLAELTGQDLAVRYHARRTSDQDVYISDTSKLTDRLDWRPRIGPIDGITDMVKEISADGSR
jgi:CDP-paratose 2-epimerase